jgi:hypothetical protein
VVLIIFYVSFPFSHNKLRKCLKWNSIKNAINNAINSIVNFFKKWIEDIKKKLEKAKQDLAEALRKGYLLDASINN